MNRPPLIALGLALLGPLGGCSIVSPLPLWELAKAGGAAASSALAFVPPQAGDTVFTPRALQLGRVPSLCIEHNPSATLGDLLPALQVELSRLQIESHIYAERAQPAGCPLWLRYTSEAEWDTPMTGDRPRAYLASLTLTLSDARGQLLSTSRFALDDQYGFGRWTSTREKVAPVLTAVLIGLEK